MRQVPDGVDKDGHTKYRTDDLNVVLRLSR